MSSEFKYLPAIVCLLTIEYIVIIGLVVYFHNRRRLRKNPTRHIPLTLNESLLCGQPFDHVYCSSFGALGWSIALLAIRLVSFSFFVAVPTIWFSVREDYGLYKYFTHWNKLLLTFYFFLATIASMIGVAEQSKEHHFETSSTVHWSKKTFIFGTIVQILFEIAGASSLFITLVVTVFNPSFSLWSVSTHVATSCVMLLELLLNSIIVRWEHLLFNLAWQYLYLLFLWPAVYFHFIDTWPYHFLYTDLYSLAWYSLLVALNIGVYLVWYGLSVLKAKYLMHVQPGTDVSDLHPHNYPHNSTANANYQHIGGGSVDGEDEENRGNVKFAEESDSESTYGSAGQNGNGKCRNGHCDNDNNDNNGVNGKAQYNTYLSSNSNIKDRRYQNALSYQHSPDNSIYNLDDIENHQSNSNINSNSNVNSNRDNDNRKQTEHSQSSNAIMSNYNIEENKDIKSMKSHKSSADSGRSDSDSSGSGLGTRSGSSEEREKKLLFDINRSNNPLHIPSYEQLHESHLYQNRKDSIDM